MNGCEANIRQLVTILMDNAVKYSPEEGSVRVSLEKKSGIWSFPSATTARRFRRGI
ncbi:ATP-binding protein [Blautia sp. RD014234]|nr:ATP-binding protein [Blautia parvula]